MSKFQIVVLSLLVLIVCIIFVAIGYIYLTLPTSDQVSPTSAPTSIPPTATPASLGSKEAFAQEITSKGWKFLKVETMSDGTRCDTYESEHVVFGLCSEEDNLKAIVITGDEFADFNPVFAIGTMLNIRYSGDFQDAVTDVWFDLSPGESTRLDLGTEGVLMIIQKTLNDGYGITYILESHIE